MDAQCTVLKGGRLIDGGGGAIVENSAVVIKGERIEAAGAADAVKIPKGAEVVDTTGKTVMPGLMDAHLHLFGMNRTNPLALMIDPPEIRGMRSVMDAWKLLDSGYTTVRCCGNTPKLTINLRNAITEGSIIGPRILSCGAIITQTGGHGDIVHSLPVEWVNQRGVGRIADGPDECRKAAREQLRDGADFIKLCSTGGVLTEKDLPTSSQYTVEEIRAIVEEAHSVGAKVASHALGTRGIKNALLEGVDSIEHGFYLDDEVIEMMLKQNTYFIPTLIIVETIATKGAEEGIPMGSVNKAKQGREAHRKSFEMACEAGVQIGCGSDFLSSPMTPMGDNAKELALQVEAGRSPMDVITSATKINAEALDIGDDVGTLEAGKLADLLVVDGDPLKDITVLNDKANILKVYKSGVEAPRLN